MNSLLPCRRPALLAESFRGEMDDLLGRFFGSRTNNDAVTVWAPSVDVEETDKELIVKADLPGVDPKDIDISVSEGALVLKGEKKETKEEKKKNYHCVERFVGQFYRSIPMPAGADASNIQAAMAKGVITITVPKKPEAQVKKIAIKAAD